MHVVLLGDSIFDNGAYTKRGPDVISQVRQLLPTGWHASLLAVDGATTESVPSQLQRLPHDASQPGAKRGRKRCPQELKYP